MAVMQKLWFFSRDERTHRLFRSSWHHAAEACGAAVQVVCRGFGASNAFAALRVFIGASGHRRVIFGTSEVCLYGAFSGKQDIWVFTGLGRLLIGNGLTSRAIRALLRFMYREQMLVVLNEADREVIQRAIGHNPVVLEGEGYRFPPTPMARPARQGLTFAYVGRLLKSKGVDQLVASFARHSRPDWTLMLIGDSDFSNRDSVPAEQIRDLTQSSQGKIISTGFRSDVAALLLEVDVLISLSRREGLPFAILDGVAAGAHLVLSPVPGHLSFDGLPGVTFVEPRELGRLFEEISDNTASFLTFDRAARLAMCEQRFGHDAITASIKDLLTAPRSALTS